MDKKTAKSNEVTQIREAYAKINQITCELGMKYAYNNLLLISFMAPVFIVLLAVLTAGFAGAAGMGGLVILAYGILFSLFPLVPILVYFTHYLSYRIIYKFPGVGAKPKEVNYWPLLAAPLGFIGLAIFFLGLLDAPNPYFLTNLISIFVLLKIVGLVFIVIFVYFCGRDIIEIFKTKEVHFGLIFGDVTSPLLLSEGKNLLKLLDAKGIESYEQIKKAKKYIRFSLGFLALFSWLPVVLYLGIPLMDCSPVFILVIAVGILPLAYGLYLQTKFGGTS
jgi:hypothetical protein